MSASGDCRTASATATATPSLQAAIAGASLSLRNPSFVHSQLWTNLYRTGRFSFDAMTDLSLKDRSLLSASFDIGMPLQKSRLVSTDGTIKWLLNFNGRADVETVYIPQVASHQQLHAKSVGTACVSSQVGCSLACAFCHTGTQKLLRNLTASEIVAQAMHVMRDVGDFPLSARSHRSMSNLVFMGQGEPLYNYRNVSAAIRFLNTVFSMAPWRTTVSTSGVAPLMGSISKDLGAGLAVSLHAVRDDLRDVLVPLNKQYPIAEVLRGCRDYLDGHAAGSPHRRITFEYVMLDGVNDTDADARQLARLVAKMPSHINLIPFNPWPGSGFASNIVRRSDIECHVRTSRGQDIMAACGQLKSLDDAKRSRVATLLAREPVASESPVPPTSLADPPSASHRHSQQSAAGQ
ncbi:ribosomal RNA large subunit methyltransferase N [Entophlyctis helioformis]|nr:ribosomal RNA large subunit methyltransferase N [Entophlyctis helioformis]